MPQERITSPQQARRVAGLTDYMAQMFGRVPSEADAVALDAYLQARNRPYPAAVRALYHEARESSCEN